MNSITKTLYFISFSIFCINFTGCGDDSVQSRFSSSSSQQGSATDSKKICKSLKSQTCEHYATKKNCTGAQQQNLCKKDLDKDDDGFICDKEFTNDNGTPSCPVDTANTKDSSKKTA